jgi:hypothetical protein
MYTIIFFQGGVMIMGNEMFRNLTTGKKFKTKQSQIFQRSLVDPGADMVSS